MMGRLFPNLSGDQVDCLVDELGDDAAIDPSQAQASPTRATSIRPTSFPDVSAISIPDLGDVSIPDNMDELMADVFPDLDDEQIDCLARGAGRRLRPVAGRRAHRHLQHRSGRPDARGLTPA